MLDLCCFNLAVVERGLYLVIEKAVMGVEGLLPQLVWEGAGGHGSGTIQTICKGLSNTKAIVLHIYKKKSSEYCLKVTLFMLNTKLLCQFQSSMSSQRKHPHPIPHKTLLLTLSMPQFSVNIRIRCIFAPVALRGLILLKCWHQIIDESVALYSQTPAITPLRHPSPLPSVRLTSAGGWNTTCHKVWPPPAHPLSSTLNWAGFPSHRFPITPGLGALTHCLQF